MIVPRFRRFAVLALAGAVVLGLTGCSKSPTDAATITYTDSGTLHTIHIVRSDFLKQLGDLVGSKQFQSLLKSGGFTLVGDQKSTTSADVSSSYLSQLVEAAALQAEISRLGLKVSPEAQDDAVQQTKSEFALSNEISQDASGNQTFIGPGVVYASFPKSLQKVLVDRTARILTLEQYYANPTTAQEQALFDEYSSTICPSGRFVAQIQVKDAATAAAIMTQLHAGASFADLAKADSKDATSAKAGGTLGCLSASTVAKSFATAAFAAPFGVAIGPVQSNLGYHIILVSHPTFADVHAELTQALQQNPLIGRDLRLQSMRVWINSQFGTGGLAVDSQQGQLLFRVTPPAVPTARTCRQDTAACSGTTTTTTVPTGAPPSG